MLTGLDLIHDWEFNDVGFDLTSGEVIMLRLSSNINLLIGH